MSRQKHRAFTLIELLVVVAIIALLISILLPSLAAAKEQAKIAKCTSNMRSLALAASMLLSDTKSNKSDARPTGVQGGDLPWALRSGTNFGGETPSFSIYCEFIWGGNMPNKTGPDWTAQFTGSGSSNDGISPRILDVYQVRPKYRPMNRYISSQVTWDANPLTIGAPRTAPPEQNEIFLCPSDSHPEVPTVGQNNPVPESVQFLRTFDWWGNSYAINWYWPYYYYNAPPGNSAPYTNGDRFLSVLGVDPGNATRSLGAEMLKGKEGGQSAEFVLFVENSLNYALEAAKPPGYTGAPWATGEGKQLVGWHGKLNYHSAAFLDGHASHQRFDTRYVFGKGWTMWPNKPWQGTWATYNDRAPL